MGIALGLTHHDANLSTKLPAIIEQLQSKKIEAKLLHLEASTAEIMRRYATTHHPHPLEREGISLVEAPQRDATRLGGVDASVFWLISASDFIYFFGQMPSEHTPLK